MDKRIIKDLFWSSSWAFAFLFTFLFTDAYMGKHFIFIVFNGLTMLYSSWEKQRESGRLWRMLPVDDKTIGRSLWVYFVASPILLGWIVYIFAMIFNHYEYENMVNKFFFLSMRLCRYVCLVSGTFIIFHLFKFSREKIWRSITGIFVLLGFVGIIGFLYFPEMQAEYNFRYYFVSMIFLVGAPSLTLLSYLLSSLSIITVPKTIHRINKRPIFKKFSNGQSHSVGMSDKIFSSLIFQAISIATILIFILTLVALSSFNKSVPMESALEHSLGLYIFVVFVFFTIALQVATSKDMIFISSPLKDMRFVSSLPMSKIKYAINCLIYAFIEIMPAFIYGYLMLRYFYTGHMDLHPINFIIMGLVVIGFCLAFMALSLLNNIAYIIYGLVIMIGMSLIMGSTLYYRLQEKWSPIYLFISLAIIAGAFYWLLSILKKRHEPYQKGTAKFI